MSDDRHPERLQTGQRLEADPSPGGAAGQWHFPNPATPPGSSAYYSIRFAPMALRDPVAALFGWRHQVRRILDDVSDPGVARLKLDWWREEIGRCRDGAPRHPLSQVLRPAFARHALPLEPFLDQARQVEDELYARRSPDDASRQRALARDRGALFELVCRCHDRADPPTLATARAVGTWCEQVRRLRDSGLLLRRGREVLPGGRLAAAGLDAEELASRRHRHRLPELLTPLADGLLAESPDADAASDLPRALRVQLRIHRALLDELSRSGLDVVDQRIGLTPLRKLWIGVITR